MDNRKLMVCFGRYSGEQVSVSDDALVSLALRGESTLEFAVDDREILSMFANDPTLLARIDGRKYRVVKVVGNRIYMHETWDSLNWLYPRVGSTEFRVDISHADAIHHIVPSLLKDTGWTEGTIDVRSDLLLQTDLLTVLENLRLLEEHSDSWLVFDSISKTASLRDDSKWQPDSAVVLSGNDLTRTIDMNVITELLPFGRREIVISSYNQGRNGLTDNPFSLSEKRQRVWMAPSVADGQTLKRLAELRLEKMSRPQVSYRGEIDLTKHGKGKTLNLGDIVTVHDASTLKARVVSLAYKMLEPQRVSVTLRGL